MVKEKLEAGAACAGVPEDAPPPDRYFEFHVKTFLGGFPSRNHEKARSPPVKKFSARGAQSSVCNFANVQNG